MRIVSWNVNGMRARIKAGFEDSVKLMNPDILCIQETRAREAQLPKDFLSDYKGLYSIHDRAGYAGATTFSRIPVIGNIPDFPGGDETGRVSITRFEGFQLINAYVPNSGQKLEKLEHRLKWQDKLYDYIAKETEPIIFCGDLNCAPEKIDSGCPSVKSGCSKEERQAHKNILSLGLKDVFRELNPNSIEYTWFSNMVKPRSFFAGMRIDAFLVSASLMPKVQNISHGYDEKMYAGSDHVPVILDINI